MSTIIEELAAVIKARSDSLARLRERIQEVLDPIPVGVVLSDDAGEVCRIVRVCTGASQWANRSWEVTIKGKGALSASGKLICDNLAGSYFDGHNLHTRKNEPTCRWEHGEPGSVLAYESGKVTRELALRLPAAIARYMETCKAETAANTEAAERVTISVDDFMPESGRHGGPSL